MKWIALALIFLTTPAVAGLIRSNHRITPWVWGLLGFLPFVLGPWHLLAAPYSTPGWPGYVKGWEVTMLDAVALGIILGTPGRWPRLTLVVPFLVYIAAVMIAVLQATSGVLAFSYVIQLVRAFLVFLAVSRVLVSARGERAVLTGMVFGLAIQAAYAIWARAGGALQTGGSLGHQNLLGFVSHLVIMPAFAMFLAARWQRVAIVGVISGIIVVILTASRATIAFSGIGLALTLIISMYAHLTGRKMMLGAAAVVLFAASYPLAQAALNRRFEAQQTAFFAEDKEREAFAQAARSMLAANPMGVGPNHYVLIANTQGYSARAGVTWSSGSRSTNVHNSYLLVAAETGYFGIFAMIGLLGSAIICALTTAFRFRRQPGAEVLIGIACGIFAMAIHGLYEWMFVVNPTQYLMAIAMGIISGMRARFMQSVKVRPNIARKGRFAGDRKAGTHRAPSDAHQAG